MKKSTIIIIVLVILAIVVSGFLAFKTINNKKSGSNSIIGEWKNDTTIEGYEFVYIFNEDGTGKYAAAGTLMPFTYKIDGDKLSILYEGDTETLDTTFSIDGDTLNVKDSFGEDTLYQRVK